jgi:hypothetical protein
MANIQDKWDFLFKNYVDKFYDGVEDSIFREIIDMAEKKEYKVQANSWEYDNLIKAIQNEINSCIESSLEPENKELRVCESLNKILKQLKEQKNTR